MVETSRDEQGRFVNGVKPGPGRPRGARSRLGEHFIEALANDFEEHGIDTIEKVRVREPATYCKIIKDILPREVLVAAFSVNASIDFGDATEARNFLKAYRLARDNPLVEAEVEAEIAWRIDE